MSHFNQKDPSGMDLAGVVVRKGRERQLLLHHPWLFSGAVDQVRGKPKPGDVVTVQTSDRQFIAYGFYNPKSQTRVRLVEWDQGEAVDDSWWFRRIDAAFQLRSTWSQEGFRAIYGEADGIPGLVCDLYGEYAVVQCTTAAVDRRKELVVNAIREAASRCRRTIRGIYERSDIDVRELEGLSAASGVLWGEAPPEFVDLQENGVQMRCSIREGQKGGYYFDQRDNRRRVASYANGRTMLDAFCYSGGFAVNALRAGVKSVTLLDSSADALELARQNLTLNGCSPSSWACEQGDVFQTLRTYRSEGRRFELVVLDPPKLAGSRADIDRALRAYKDLNLQAMWLLEAGGILATFSCSGRVSREQFRTAVAWAAKDAGREALIIESLSQTPDHPISLSFPESEYLKGFILYVR